MPIPCARCETPLPAYGLNDVAFCPSCGSRNDVRLFPALFVPSKPPDRAESALEGEAACFDHPSKRAVGACHLCGRFVCVLCMVEFGGQVWCPACVAAGKPQGKAVNLDASRVLFDSIALSIPLTSLIVWPLTVIAGPGALVFSLMTWRRPLSPVRRYRWRFVVAVLFGLTESLGWLLLIVFWWEAFRTGQNASPQ